MTGTIPPVITGALALLLCSAGVFLLWRYWRYKNSSIGNLIIASILLAGSSALCIANTGPEFGTVYFLITISIIAWLLIIITSDSQPTKATPARYQHRNILVNKTNKAQKSQTVARWFIMFVLCGFTSVLTTMVLALMFPVSLTNQLVITALSFPLVWSIFSLWVSVTEHLLKSFMLIASLTGLMVLTLFGVLA